jgi:hypothetical protein
VAETAPTSAACIAEAIAMLEAAGAVMARFAALADVPVTTARRLLRARDTVDAHLLAAASLQELGMADDARRLLARAADVVEALFEPVQDVATG